MGYDNHRVNVIRCPNVDLQRTRWSTLCRMAPRSSWQFGVEFGSRNQQAPAATKGVAPPEGHW